MLRMRENAKGRFSLKSPQIPSLLAAAAVAARSLVQAPTTPEGTVFRVPELWLELRVFKTMNSGLLVALLFNLPPLKQIV